MTYAAVIELIHLATMVLDDSVDGVNLSAVWAGDPVDCGRGFEGERRPDTATGTGNKRDLIAEVGHPTVQRACRTYERLTSLPPSSFGHSA